VAVAAPLAAVVAGADVTVATAAVVGTGDGVVPVAGTPPPQATSTIVSSSGSNVR